MNLQEKSPVLRLTLILMVNNEKNAVPEAGISICLAWSPSYAGDCDAYVCVPSESKSCADD